ncbi:DUF6374 family protein [Nocardia sp. NPDC050710]|uniref:DUF6374 family protein n=1 Tax=Nocardia sp. NPDC050710 TaxID=3157220 RepID=UPI0033D25CCD
MPQLSRLDWAYMYIDDVRRQLTDAAASGRTLMPDELEHAAGKLSEGLRIYVEETQHRR